MILILLIYPLPKCREHINVNFNLKGEVFLINEILTISLYQKRVSFGDTLKNYFKNMLGLIFNMEHILRKVNVEGSASPFS